MIAKDYYILLIISKTKKILNWNLKIKLDLIFSFYTPITKSFYDSVGLIDLDRNHLIRYSAFKFIIIKYIYKL